MPLLASWIFFQRQPIYSDHTNSEDRQEKDKHRDLAAEGQSRDLGGYLVGLHRLQAWPSALPS